MAKKPDLGNAPTLSLSNGTTELLTIWLEPWAEEFALGPRSELALYLTMVGTRAPELPEIDYSDGLIAVYAPAGSLMRVVIDGIEQDSSSATIGTPDIDGISPRFFVNTAFKGFPEARPGGVPLPAPAKLGWFSRWLARR